MNRVRTLILFFIILYSTSCWSLQAGVHDNVILTIDNSYAPFEFNNPKDKADGFSTNIFEAIAKAVNIPYTCDFKDALTHQYPQNKKDKRITIIYGIDSTTTRKYVISKPFGYIDNDLICRQGSDINQWEDLNGKTIIFLQGRTPIGFLAQRNITPNIIYVNNTPDGLRLLASGKYDAMISSNDVAYYYIKHLKLDNLSVRSLYIQPLPLHFAMERNKTNVLLMKKIDTGLRIIKNNGSYDKIYSRWFIPLQELPLSIAWTVTCGVLVILILALIIRLKHLKRHAKISEAKLSTSKKEQQALISNMHTIYAALHVSVAFFQKDGKQTYVNDDFIKLSKTPNLFFPLKVDENLFDSGILTSDQKEIIKSGKPISFNFDATSDLSIFLGLHSDRFPESKIQSIAVIPAKDLNGDIYNYVMIIRDISKETKTARKLKQLSALLQIASDSAGLLIGYYNIRENAYYAIENMQLQKTEYSYESTLQRIHPLYRAAYNEFFIKAKNGECGIKSLMTYVFVEKANCYKFHTMTIDCVRDESYNIIGLIQTVKDIDSTRKQALEIEDLNFLLELTSKFANLKIWNYFVGTKEVNFLFAPNNFKETTIKHFEEITHPEDRAKAQEVLNEILSGERSKSYCVLRTKVNASQQYRYIESNLIAIKNTDATLQRIVGISRDITESYIHLRDLEEERINTQLISDKGKISQFVYDPIDREFKLTPQFLSNVYDIDIHNIKNHIAPESISVYQKIQAYMKSNTLTDFSTKLNLKSPVTNSRIYLDVTITPFSNDNQTVFKYVGTIRDDTQSIQLNMKLNQTLEQNKIILSNLQSGIGLLSSKFEILWGNFSNLPEKHIFNRYHAGCVCYRDVYHRQKPCEECPISKSMETRSSIQYNRIWENRTYRITSTPAYDTNGIFIGNVLKADDITDEKSLVNALEKAKKESEARNAARNRFFANINTEIGNPLNAITQYVELMLKSDNQETRRLYLNTIIQSKCELLNYINDLQQLSLLELGDTKLNKSRFDFEEIFQRTIDFYNDDTATSFNIIRSIKYSSCFIISDKDLIDQFLHLIVEQIINMKLGDSISIDYEYYRNSIHISYVFKPNPVVKENILTNKDLMPKLSESIGIAICQAMLSLLKGSITTDIILNGNANFTVTLPCKANLK